MKNYLLLSIFILFFSACATKVDKTIQSSNTDDSAYFLQLLSAKEKEINDIIKELEECKATKK